MSQEEFVKRGAARFLAGLAATLHYRGAEYTCGAENLSRSGVLLTGRVPWPGDELVDLTLRSARGDLRLRCRARVVRVAQGDAADEARIALEFEGLDDRGRATLDALVARVIEGTVPAPLEQLEAGASLGAVRAALQHVPLPHRIALAQRAQNREREILMQDGSAQVLEALARNPNLTPVEVRTLLRQRDLLPTTLRIVLADSRWSRDEEILILVASHPRVSAAIAKDAVERLGETGRLALLRRPGLPAIVRTELMKDASRLRRKLW